MCYPEFHYRWSWQLGHTPAELWPYIADTNRFNHNTGLPCVECHPLTPEESVNARRKLSFKRMGVTVEWTEEPFEWLEPRRSGVVRRNSRGPVDRMRVVAELEPYQDGTRLFYQIWARPANPIGLLAIPIQIGRLTSRAFGRVFTQYDEWIEEDRRPTQEQTQSFVSGGRHRLTGELVNAGADPDVTEALGRAVVEGSDLDLIKMRPYALADEWALPRRTVLDAFLLSTRLGLHDVSWDVLCPLCRGAKDTTTNLAGILPQVHCETCNIDFDVDFDRSVELTFRPGSTIREVGRTEYCVAGPRVTPHVVVQQLLQPSEKRIVSPELEEGPHRIRTLRLARGRYLDVKDEGPSSVDVDATPSGWGREAVAIGLTPTLSLRNDTDEEQLFVLERMVVDGFCGHGRRIHPPCSGTGTSSLSTPFAPGSGSLSETSPSCSPICADRPECIGKSGMPPRSGW